MRILQDVEYVSVAEAKAKLSEKIRRVIESGRRFVITSHGKPQAVLIDYKEYISLIEPAEEGQQIDSLEEWQGRKKERGKIIESISSLFDESKLSKKGQKEYKTGEVKKISKVKKRA
ncbi:MAG: type II toxin-antitoxin system Phd/YefM family antitoxin [Pseudomonadota bacterium]